MSAAPRVAIVGMSVRVADAAGVEAFRAQLASGRHAFRPVPTDRFDPVALGAEAPPGFAPAAALVEPVALDWRALRLPPLQAERLHQGERLALQTMLEALRDAGWSLDEGPQERAQIRIAATTLGPDPAIDPMRRIRRHRLASPLRDALSRIAPGQREPTLAILDRLVDLACPPLEPDALFTSASIVAGRASNLFDFRGGHLAIDVGAASSLAAVHESVEALSRGECDLALVCGVAPLVVPSALLALAHRGEAASRAVEPFGDGHGTVLGEGAVALALVREADAGARRVWALIESVAGAARPGAPDPARLRTCVAEAAAAALSGAGADRADVDGIVSRAAGLPSDRAEWDGLSEAYAGQGLPVASCVPSSGFLQGASGLLALAQAALALHHGERPAGASRRLPASPAPGPSGGEPAPRRLAVSDAGPDPVAWHAVLSAPAQAARPARPARAPRARDEGFAIVGLGVVVPGANDVPTFWRNALDRLDPIRDLPRSRFDVEALVGRNAELAHAFRTRLAATVELPRFDPARFGLDAGRLASLDPAVPVALLASAQALEDARWSAAAPGRSKAVFGQLSLRPSEAAAETRIAFGNTLALAEEAMREAGLDEAAVAAVVAEARRIFDARGASRWATIPDTTTGLALTSTVAAALGLGGVPLTVDAACASSLAAVLAGCNALARGDADVVLAGGVAYNLLPEYYVGLGLLGALSPRGGLPFHPDAEGFIPAEGAGAVVLKRLADARADGDRVYAVVRGHGVSSDGRGLSIYSPSSAGQQLALRRALAEAGLEPGAIDLVEAHGPGTRLGDRTEVASYAAVYGAATRADPLVLSASKSQVGHTTSAAGLVALVRACLALHHGVVPPSNVEGGADPALRLETLPAVLGSEPRPWASAAGRRRRAAVSAFGMAGVNHHLVLEEPGAEPDAAARPCPPATALEADRLVLDLAPLALPARPPRLDLRGRSVRVVGDARGPARAIASAFAERGASAAVVDPARLAEEAGGEVDVWVDVTAFGPGAPTTAATLSATRAAVRSCFAAVRCAYERLAAAGPERPAAWVTVTSLGGELGLTGRGAGELAGAYHHGLALSLKQEAPGALVKAIDFDPATPAANVAAAVAAEVLDGNERVQVAWVAGRRLVPVLRRAPHDGPPPPARRIGAEDVFLFSGGGRGVVFECAAAVARLGAKVVVTGRAPLPDPSLPHLSLDDEAFAAFRRGEIVRRRREPGLTPVRFAAEMAALSRERELHRNVERARAEGLAIAYEVCDFTDAAAVRALVARVRAGHGRITWLGHGAMVERSASVPSKTDLDLARSFDSKVAALVHLLDATEEDALQGIVAFGSGVARFGNRGQTDYGGANALMAAILAARAARRAHPLRAVTVDWPAWRDTGWAAANPDVSAGLDAAGVTSISPEEGRYWFLAELLEGHGGAALIASERMLHRWPFLGAGAEGAGSPPALDDTGAPLVAGALPLLDDVLERAPGRVVAARRLHAGEPFLAQHRVDGRPVLPGAFALELLAEAASLLAPGERLAEVRAFRIEAPVALVRDDVQVRLEAAVRGDEIDVRLVSTTPHAPPASRERRHATASFRFGREPPPPRRAEIPEGDGPIRARSFYRVSRDPVELGPLFCRARWIEIGSAEARAFVEPFDPRRPLAATSWPAFQLDPLLLDSAFQVAGSLEGYGEAWVCVPLGLEALRVGRAPALGERARVRATRVGGEGPRVRYDLAVTTVDGEVLLEVDGLVLHRVSPAEAAA